MPETLTNPLSRWFLACTVLLPQSRFRPTVCPVRPGRAPPGAAPPQAPPPAPGATGNPICQRLEASLPPSTAAAAGDPAKDEQIRRYQDSQRAKQQAELDRVTSQAKRMGCDSSGFFSLFNGQSAQCGPVNNQIQQMRANLDQITTSLERLRSGGLGGADRENQRRSVMTALAQNNCGPQYAAAARGNRRARGSFLGDLFGNNNNRERRCRRRFRRRSPAPTARSACAPATAPTSRSRLQPCRRASPTTRRPARRCVRRRKPRSTPIAIPAKT